MMTENIETSLAWRLKLLIWSVSAGVIIAFFFSSNFLAWATSFNPGGTALLVSPITCGFILGIITWEYDAIQTVWGVFILTITATLLVSVTMVSPTLFGVAILLDTYYIFVAQNAMITIILVLPLALLGAMLGRVFSENMITSTLYREDREMLRKETEEWYRMLEEKLEEKRAALESLREDESGGEN